MTRHPALFLLILIFVFLSSTPTPARALGWNAVIPTDAPVTITVESPFSQLPRIGTLPVTFTIENTTNSELAYTLTNRTNSGRSNDQTSASTTQRVRVPASQRISVDLLAPIPSSPTKNYRAAYVTISGPFVESGTKKISFPGAPPARGAETTFTLMSRDLALRTWSPLEELAKKESYPLVGCSFDPEKLPTDWRGLTGAATLWITDTELDALRPDQRSALNSWIRQGGRLFWVLPKNSTRTLAEFIPSDPEAKAANIGLGSVTLRRWDRRELPTSETFATLKADRPRFDEQISSDYITGWGLANVLGKLRFPVPLLITFITLFAITIGPLNLFWFARSGRRQRLFWTTPLISLVASLLLGAIIWFQDGSGGTGQRLTFALLLPDTNQMLIRQEQVSRTGVLFDRTFTLDEPALVLPIPLTANTASEPSRNLRQTGETLSGDWFSSRTVQAQYLEAIVPTRARIELINTAPDGTPTLLSSVPETLDKILYTDAQGKRWHAAPLRTGEQAKLTPATEAQSNAIFRADDSGPLIRSPWTSQQKTPNVFHAISTTGPTLATLPAIRWKTSQTLLTGLVNTIP